MKKYFFKIPFTNWFVQIQFIKDDYCQCGGFCEGTCDK